MTYDWPDLSIFIMNTYGKRGGGRVHIVAFDFETNDM